MNIGIGIERLKYIPFQVSLSGGSVSSNPDIVLKRLSDDFSTLLGASNITVNTVMKRLIKGLTLIYLHLISLVLVAIMNLVRKRFILYKRCLDRHWVMMVAPISSFWNDTTPSLDDPRDPITEALHWPIQSTQFTVV